MNKPNNYDSTSTSSGFIPIELGGHTATIKRVQESTSSSGRPMIVVAIDFDNQDKQPGYFSKQFEEDTREEKKWPYQGMQWILTEDENGNCSRSFKAFISCVERSNNSDCVWGDGFEQWFKNKKIGVVYGENEEEYNGEVRSRHKIRYFCQYDKAPGASVPDKKFIKEPKSSNSGDLNKWVNVPEEAESEIPF